MRWVWMASNTAVENGCTDKVRIMQSTASIGEPKQNLILTGW